jgi:glycerate 2-kinase
VLDHWAIPVPASVTAALARKTGVLAPTDPRLSHVENRIYAAPAQSLAAAAAMARAAGYEVRLLGDAIEGEARDVAAAQAAMALQIKADRTPDTPSILLLSGGELTVTRRGNGIGGPNAEFALALAIALKGTAGIYAIACDTDGVDGAAEVAGAMIGPTTLDLAKAQGADPARALAENDAHSFFATIAGQVVTGPTLTNVNDFRAILIV